MILGLEHVEHVRPERLCGHHDEGTVRIGLARGGERARGAVHGDVDLTQRVDELDRREEIGLVRRNDVPARIAVLRLPQLGPELPVSLGRAAAAAAHLFGDHPQPRRRGRPRILTAALDRPSPHRVDVVEQVLPVARRVVDDRAVERDRIVDRLLEPPLLRCDRVGEIPVGYLALDDERNPHRRRAADRLCQDGDDVVKVAGVANPAVPPAVVRAAGCHRGAGLSLGRQPLVHVRAERLQAEDEQRVEIVVVGVALRRGPDDGAGRPALVVVVENLRQPVVVEDAVDVLRLGLSRREEVAVVVVADVLLIEPRQARGAALQRIRIPHVPIGDEVVAVRVGVDEEDDALVEEPQRLGVRPADHLVDHLGELLRAERFGRVQSSVDPDDRFPFSRERPRLVFADAVGKRQAA